MYIRKAKNEEDGGEDSGEAETYQKPQQYWSPENSKVQEQESDYKGLYSEFFVIRRLLKGNTQATARDGAEGEGDTAGEVATSVTTSP